MKKLYICCNEKDKPEYVQKAKKAYLGILKIEAKKTNADLVYIVGKETPNVKEEIEFFKKNKIKMVRVDENFISADFFRNSPNIKKRDLDRERE